MLLVVKRKGVWFIAPAFCLPLPRHPDILSFVVFTLPGKYLTSRLAFDNMCFMDAEQSNFSASFRRILCERRNAGSSLQIQSLTASAGVPLLCQAAVREQAPVSTSNVRSLTVAARRDDAT